MRSGLALETAKLSSLTYRRCTLELDQACLKRTHRASAPAEEFQLETTVVWCLFSLKGVKEDERELDNPIGPHQNPTQATANVKDSRAISRITAEYLAQEQLTGAHLCLLTGSMKVQIVPARSVICGSMASWISTFTALVMLLYACSASWDCETWPSSHVGSDVEDVVLSLGEFVFEQPKFMLG